MADLSPEFWDELEREGLIDPPVKAREVRLERRMTEAREAREAERQARLQRIREESMLDIGDGDVMYLDVLPERATHQDMLDHLAPGGTELFGEDDMLDSDAGRHRGGSWPE